MENSTVKLNADIKVGNATLIGTETGWALLNGGHTTLESRAWDYAKQMSEMMVGYVMEGK